MFCLYIFTGDFDLKNVTPARSSIVSYDGGNIPVLGTVERVFHLSVVVSSCRKQALSSYFGQVSLQRDGCR